MWDHAGEDRQQQEGTGRPSALAQPRTAGFEAYEVGHSGGSGIPKGPVLQCAQPQGDGEALCLQLAVSRETLR